MKHYIIVKFTEGTDVKALVEPVRAIFEETLAIHFRHGQGGAPRICGVRAAPEMEKRVRGQDREESNFRL